MKKDLSSCEYWMHIGMCHLCVHYRKCVHTKDLP